MQLLCVKLGRQGSLRAAQQAQQPHCLSSYPNCAFTVLCSFPRATGNEQIRGELFIPTLFYSELHEICKGTEIKTGK